MRLESKIELLKYYVMTSRTNYNLYTYHCINLECLEIFIDEIDDDSFYVEKIIECGINAKRFVRLLDYLIMDY